MVGWEEPLCGCFKDCCNCMIVSCVPGGYCFVQALAVAKSNNTGCFRPYLCPCLLGCFGAAYNRGRIRSRYLIEGNYVSDCIHHALCGPCAVCQEHREIHRREFRG